jgi:TolB-like protein
VIALVAMVGVAAFVGVRASRRPPAPASAGEAAIAVVPFSSVGGDGDDSLLVDGVSTDLMQGIARLGAARVLTVDAGRAIRARSGTRRRAILDSLGVTHVVDGDIRWSGPRLRAEVRLLDATGATRWSETYDRPRDEVFVIQREAAIGVARALGLPIASASMRALDRPLTRNIAAYELFLRGRDQSNFRFVSDSGLRRGLAYLQQAVALDSGFAAAYANMTYMYSLIGARSSVPESGFVYMRRADSVARKAMVLDPMLPESHAALAVANLSGFRDLGTAERELRRSIALGGAPRVHEHLANVLSMTGRTQEALVETMRAAAEDPLSATATAELGKALCANGRFEEGLAKLAIAATVKPPLLRVPGHVALCHGMRGDWPRAVEVLRPAHAGPASPLFGYALARAGQTAEATAMRDEMITRWNATRRGAYGVAAISAGLRDRDQTFLWLDRAVDDLSIQYALQYSLLFRELHGDPRWARFLGRVGFRSDTAGRAGAGTPTPPAR